jgi:hypothetical protein
MDTEQPSAFRGSSGEVVRGFIDLSTLATLVPVLVSMVVLGVLAGLIMNAVGLSLPFAVLLMLVTSSPIVGRFAVASRDGQLDAGFFSARADRGAVVGFVLRHATLAVAWGLPLALIVHFLVGRSERGMMGIGLPSGGTGLLLLLLGAIATVAQLLSLLIATKADSVGEAVTVDAWRWALVERRADLVPLVAALAGGLMVFGMIAWPLLGLLSLLLAQGSAKLGAALAVFAYASPVLAAPVLLGRLCGAFVAGEGPTNEAIPATAAPTPSGPVAPGSTPVGGPGSALAAGPRTLTPVASPASPIETAVQAARRLDVRQALDAVRMKTATDLPAAVNEARILRDAYPANPIVAVELAKLLRQAGHGTEAAAAASVAIRVALSAGTAPLAVELWKLCEGERETMELDAGTLEQLGRHLTTRKELDDAAWCFRTMKKKGADAIRVQKGLIGVAEAIARDGNPRGATQLYRFILSEFPHSTLRDYIESAIAQLDLKAAAGRR